MGLILCWILLLIVLYALIYGGRPTYGSLSSHLNLVSYRPLSNDESISRQARPRWAPPFLTQSPHILSKWSKGDRITNYRFQTVLVHSSSLMFDFKNHTHDSLITARIVPNAYEEFCERSTDTLGIRTCESSIEFDVKLEASLYFYQEMEPKVTVIVCIIKMIDFLPQYLQDIQVIFTFNAQTNTLICFIPQNMV